MAGIGAFASAVFIYSVLAALRGFACAIIIAPINAVTGAQAGFVKTAAILALQITTGFSADIAAVGAALWAQAPPTQIASVLTIFRAACLACCIASVCAFL